MSISPDNATDIIANPSTTGLVNKRLDLALAELKNLIAASDTWDEVMHNGALFTILNNENLSATITQNDTTNNPAALVINNTGSGNDITLPNSSYIKNGALVMATSVTATALYAGSHLSITESTNDTIFYNDAGDFNFKLPDALGVRAFNVLDINDVIRLIIDSNGGVEYLIGSDAVEDLKNAAGIIKAKISSVGDSFINGGNTEFGGTTPVCKVTVTGDINFTPSSTQTMVAATGITQAMIEANALVKLAGNAGNITITATPSIVGGKDGQLIILRGTSNTDTVTLQDESNLAGSDLNLAGGANFTFGKGDILGVICDTTDGKYYEVFRSNNTYTA